MYYRIIMFETRVRRMGRSLAIYLPSSSKLPPCSTFCCEIVEGKLVYTCGEVCEKRVSMRGQRVHNHVYHWLTIPAVYARVLGISENTKVKVSLEGGRITIEKVGGEQ